MKKAVWQVKNKNYSDKNILYLSKQDINHLERIYKKYNLEPESFDEVQIDYLADREYLIRYIIKELDILLKVGGKFIINSTYTAAHANFIRSKSQIKYEFSVSTNGRYKLSNQYIYKYKLKLVYIKNTQTLHCDDSIDKWSFGIITNGQKNEQVNNLINSIIKQNIPNYEILICGKFTFEDYRKYPILPIDDVVLKDDIRAPITIKKNKIASQAQYQNLMIMHDRYLLPDDWFLNMKKYGNYFDILTMPNIGPSGGRVNDWGEHLGQPSQIYDEVTHILPYNKWSIGWYSQGGLIIIKKHLYMDNMLDKRLHWDELEDVAWSQIGHLKGWMYYLDINNKIYTFSDRLNESSVIPKDFMPLRKVVEYLRRHIPHKIKYFLIHKKHINEKQFCK